VQNKIRSQSKRHHRTVVAIFTILVTALLVLSVLIIPRAISTYAVSSTGPNPHYVPSNAFGDSDDLPASALKSSARGLAAGNSSVSGTVIDASSGQPVANALVGISAGAVRSTAQYATTASDGSYSFSGIASGTYNLAASRYSLSGTQPFYRDAQQMQVNVSGSVTVNFKLAPIPVPAARTVPAGRAKNLIIVDFDETYYDSWFADTQSMANKSPATHQLAQSGVVASEAWTQYGWSPIDHYQIATGSYPAWRSPDAPGKVWGQPDGLDTNIWYNGTEKFGQESIFDVAKSYGMNTAVIGGNDYPTGHITDTNVDQISLGQNINGVPTQWVTEVQNFITAHASNPNGFLVYMPVTEAEGRSVESTSPQDGSSQGLYQQASSWDDQTLGQLLAWLQQNNYTGSTAISVTSDEAENDHTQFDNFYGLGSTGQGSTRHLPFVFAGPGIVSGHTYNSTLGIDDMSTNYMYALGLPAPVDSRGQVISSFFTAGGTPVPQPTATNPPQPTPTATPTSIPTSGPSPTTTAAPSPTNPPPSTPTPAPGSNLVQNGGFEASGGWVYSGAYHPRRSKTQAHRGAYSLRLGSSRGQHGDAVAYQVVTIPGGAQKISLSFYYWPASNDSSTYGWQEADVIDSSGNFLQQLFVNTTDDQNWVQMSFELSKYAGRTIGIRFLDHEQSGSGSYYTYMYVDDVTVNVS
jgi:hypothetical protein